MAAADACVMRGKEYMCKAVNMLATSTRRGQRSCAEAHVMRGKEYIAPSVKLHVTPSRLLKKSVTVCALRRRLALSASCKCARLVTANVSNNRSDLAAARSLCAPCFVGNHAVRQIACASIRDGDSRRKCTRSVEFRPAGSRLHHRRSCSRHTNQLHNLTTTC
jgi:hypothetical protein